MEQDDSNNFYTASMEDILRTGNPGEYCYIPFRSENINHLLTLVDRVSMKCYSHWLLNLSSSKVCIDSTPVDEMDVLEIINIPKEKNQEGSIPSLEHVSEISFSGFSIASNAICCDPYLKSNIITFHALVSSCTASAGLEESVGTSLEWREIVSFFMGLFYSQLKSSCCNESEHLLENRHKKIGLNDALKERDLHLDSVLMNHRPMYGSIGKIEVTPKDTENRLSSIGSAQIKSDQGRLDSLNNPFKKNKIEISGLTETTPLLDSIKKGESIPAAESKSPKKKFFGVKPFTGSGLRKAFSCEAVRDKENTSLFKKSLEEMRLERSSFE
ncbi:MAG: hypothetical protein K9M81_00620 [Chthoniobacterales bacterium]|nr:hypothetical protein [Chthoniobacterales bacterium]